MKIEIVSGKTKYEFEVYTKYNYIDGLSGRGKTWISSILPRFSTKVFIDGEEFSNKAIAYISKEQNMRSVVSVDNDEQRIVILDEVNWTWYRENKINVSKLLNDTPYIYIIYGRGLPELPIPDIGILEYTADGMIHSAKPIKFNYRNTVLDFDYILTEDKHSGYDFFQTYTNIPVVYSDNGRPGLDDKLSTLSGKILVIMDACGINSTLLDLKVYSDNQNIVIPRIESFEWLLLNTNLIGWEGVVDYFNSNNIEEEYERILGNELRKITGLSIGYSKSTEYNCFNSPCCVQGRYGCEYNMKRAVGNKIEYLFSGTQFQWMLSFMSSDKGWYKYLRVADKIYKFTPESLRLDTVMETIKRLYAEDREYLEEVYKLC